jgi:hypothetical protein
MSEKQIMTVPRKAGVDPHCETVYPNHYCPYIQLGCTGCKLKYIDFSPCSVSAFLLLLKINLDSRLRGNDKGEI